MAAISVFEVNDDLYLLTLFFIFCTEVFFGKRLSIYLKTVYNVYRLLLKGCYSKYEQTINSPKIFLKCIGIRIF